MKKFKKLINLLATLFICFVLFLGTTVLVLVLQCFSSHSYENVYISNKEYDEYIDEFMITGVKGFTLQYFTISSNLYDQIEVGQTYSLNTKGWDSNIIFIDAYEEIVGIQQILKN